MNLTKRHYTGAVIVLLIAAAAFITRESEKTESTADQVQRTAPPTLIQDTPEASRAPAQVTQPSASTPKLTQNALPGGTSSKTQGERDSLQDMAKTLYQFTRPSVPLKDLVEYLNRGHQDPLVTKNSNPDTGEMAIVRTKSPLPGTRYFHAQYFTDENSQSFVQHMSFEYKASPTAMNEAIAAVQSSFPQMAAPHVQRPDYVRWSADDGYIVWVKKLTADDLKDDPFNAYTPDDIGTVRVAVEAEIHGHGDEDHSTH